MGNRNFEKVINKDNVWNSNCDITDASDVTSTKEYIQVIIYLIIVYYTLNNKKFINNIINTENLLILFYYNKYYKSIKI